MEFAQVGHHLWRGNYLAYPAQAGIGPKIFLLAPWDKTLRQAWRSWLSQVIRRPQRLFEKLYLQSVAVIQAPDLLPDGRADMCDSCPDMTVYEGKLINSCRMDEYRLFGGLLAVVERPEPEQLEAAERAPVEVDALPGR